jgi:hypothetical protein
MPYQIKKRQIDQAKRIGVSIQPSSNPNKKIDVFKDGKKVVSIGGAGYGDYATYLEKDKKLAEEKRKNYKARHEKDRKVVGSAGWYADQILWN